MTIFVNNQSLEFSVPLYLDHLLQNLGFHQAKGLAIAVNNQVVPKSAWEIYELQESDKITIIRATQGG